MFYLTCGCAYEFLKCYREKSEEADDSEDMDSDIERNNDPERHNREAAAGEEEGEKKEENKWMITLVIVGGILCQPLYLMFYLIYGMMECYRKLGCWFYYAG